MKTHMTTIIAATFLFCFASLTAAQTGDSTDPFGTAGLTQAVIDLSPVRPSGTSQDMIATATSSRQVSISSEDGQVDLFNPTAARDVMASFQNSGSGEVQIQLTTARETAPVFETVLAGRSLSRLYAAVTDIKASCIGDAAGPANCVFDLKLVSATSPADHPEDFPLGIWYDGPAVAGDADVEPDSWGDCLWETDTVYDSNVARDIQLDVTLTGNHDAFVRVIYSNDTEAGYDLAAPPALPQNQILTEFFTDVKAVRVQCYKSPVNACDNCKYSYSVTIIP